MTMADAVMMRVYRLDLQTIGESYRDIGSDVTCYRAVVAVALDDAPQIVAVCTEHLPVTTDRVRSIDGKDCWVFWESAFIFDSEQDAVIFASQICRYVVTSEVVSSAYRTSQMLLAVRQIDAAKELLFQTFVLRV